MNVDLTTVAGIVALTLTLTQFLKGYVPRHTRLLAIALGVLFSVLGYFAPALGALPILVTKVIVAILGAPMLYDVVNGK